MNLITGLRQRPLLADSLLAVTVAIFTLIESTQPARTYSHPAVMIPAAILCTLPLAARRRNPLGVLIFILAVNTLAVSVVTSPASAGLFVSILIAVYSVFVQCSRRVRLAVIPVIVAGAAVEMARDPSTHSVVEALPTFAILAAVVMLAQVVRRSRDQAARLRQLAAELAASRAEAEELAVAAERLRIAREMHDVLAHGVSVMVLQIGAARMVLSESAPQVRKVLAGVEDLGRQALEDLRGILGLLRDPAGAAAEQSPLLPGDFQRLFATMRTAGLPLSVEGADSIAMLPDPLVRTVFRVIQEALTNALKHSGPAATTVDIRVGARDVTVDVHDKGSTASTHSTLAGGNGLIGLRERVSVVGGTLISGPSTSGGWQLRMTVPCALQSELLTPVGTGS